MPLRGGSGLHRGVIHKILAQKNKFIKPETCVALATTLEVSPVTVFRAAGLLPPEPDLPSWWEDLKVIMLQMSEQSQQELLAIAKVKLKFEQQGTVTVQ